MNKEQHTKGGGIVFRPYFEGESFGRLEYSLMLFYKNLSIHTAHTLMSKIYQISETDYYKKMESFYLDCCRVTNTVARDGEVTVQIAPPLINAGESKTLYLSQGNLPGAGGNFPVNHTVTDPIGREIYSIHYVASDGIGNIASGYHAQTNITTYPAGTDNYRITIDSTGIITTNITYYGTFDITYSRGIKTTITYMAGGATTTRQEWADPVSGIDHIKATMTESETQADGCESRTSYVKYDDGNWLTQSVTTSDFLGRVVASSRAGAGGVMLTTSNVYNNKGLLVQTVNHDGSSVVYAYNELTERTVIINIAAGQTLDFDPLSFTLANIVLLNKYVISLTTESTEHTEGEWWRCATSMFYKP
ncbi:MAG: hypothetical protein PHY48_15910, partial [Candidatus Cloacimonetes bacterium]|nr:hypothetical protein [Candidatus Cloacimonadota bacterium]